MNKDSCYTENPEEKVSVEENSLLKNTSKEKCVPTWNYSHVVSMYFPSDGWWDVNHLWNQTGPVQAPVPTGTSCFWLARSLCPEEQPLLLGVCEGQEISHWPSCLHRYTFLKLSIQQRYAGQTGQNGGESHMGLTAHDPSKSGLSRTAKSVLGEPSDGIIIDGQTV